MSASNCPETPRQKMIQMMYLVYTAMLALNVSAQVIDGFKNVGQAMTQANQNVEAKISDTFDNFAAAAKNNPEKVTANYEKALEIKKMSEELGYFLDTSLYSFLTHIESGKEVEILLPNPEKPTKPIPVKVKLRNDDGTVNFDSVAYAIKIGGFSWIAKLDDTHEATRYFLNSKEDQDTAIDGAAVEVKNRVRAYKKRIKDLLGEDSSKVNLAMAIESNVIYSDPGGAAVSWEMLNFRNGVAGGALVAMVRLKAEMLNAEYEASNMLYKQISANDYSFDQVAVLCRPVSTYIMQGQKFEMVVNVGAYDSRNHFKANIGGQTFNSNDTGAVVYTAAGTTTGPKTVTGTVYVTKDGGTTEYPFKQSYFVAEPLAVFELTEMNVVYNGIDNPIKITVSGAAAHDVVVSTADPSLADIFPAKRVKEMENGKEVTKYVRATDKTGDAGYYVIFPKKASGTVVVTASVRSGKGLTPMGSQNLRIKKIPDPKLYLGKYASGSSISISEFRTFKAASARYGDDFAFHMKLPTVNKQTIDIARAQVMDHENNGANWNPETMAIMQKVRPGYKVNITATVTLPNGEKRPVEGAFRIVK